MNDKAIITAAANRYGVSPKILWGLYGTETGFGKNVSRSSAGAVGPFQFLPSTAKGMGVNPYDFKSAAFGAARYLSQYRNRGVAGMLSAYNAGPAGGLQRGYVETTLKNSKSYDGSPGGTISNSAPSLPSSSSPTQSQPTSTFNQAGFDKAQKAAILGRLLSADRKDNPLFASGLVSTKAPDRSEYEHTTTTSSSPPIPGAQPLSTGGHLVPNKGFSVYIPPQAGTGPRGTGPVPQPRDVRLPKTTSTSSNAAKVAPALHFKERAEREGTGRQSAERTAHRFPHYEAQTVRLYKETHKRKGR